MKRALLYAGLAATAAVALPAAAQEAKTTTTVDVHAGPSSDYPQVGVLGPGTGVHVNGCLNDWSWCDVDFGNDRGWIYAGDLAYRYRNGPVPILQYGAQVGLPVLSFSLNDYWNQHYRGRPWFAQRDEWAHRNVAHEHRGGDRDARAMRDNDVRDDRNAMRGDHGVARDAGGTARDERGARNESAQRSGERSDRADRDEEHNPR